MSKIEFTADGKLDIDEILKQVSTKAEADNSNAIVEKCKSKIVEAMNYALLQAYKDAKDQPSSGPYPPEMQGHLPPHQPYYVDWTANLRSSIGYELLRDGEEVYSMFEGESEGTSAGKNAAKASANESNSSIVGVLAAGMDYALEVESKGYNVITQQTESIKENFERHLSTLKNGQ